MNNVKFDEEIRSRLLKENEVIPDNINRCIDDALNSLKYKKKKKIKAVVVAVASFALCFSGMNIAANAQGMSLKEYVYQIFDFGKKYNDYSTELNLSKEYNGIKLTFIDTNYDGYKLRLNYKVESTESDTVDAVKHFKLATSLNTKIDGEKISFSSNGGEYLGDEGCIIGSIDFDINIFSDDAINLMGKKIEEGAKLNCEINDAMFVGNIDIPLSKDKLNGKIKEVSVNKQVGDVTINRIVITPLCIYVFVNTESNIDTKNIEDNPILNAKLVDNNGVEHKRQTCETENDGAREFCCQFDNSNEDFQIKSIKFMPLNTNDNILIEVD